MSDPIKVRTAEEIAVGSPDGLTAEKMTKDDSAIAELIGLAESTLDPKDMLAKYAALGSAFVKHAQWQKSQFPAWAKEDYDRLADRIETEVKFRVAIKDVRMDVYVRVYAFVEAVRPMAPGIDKVSYFQVANKFLPMLHWSKVDLEGEIKGEWLGFVRETIERQASANPLKIKELDAAIEAHKLEIKREAAAKKDPSKALAEELRAANAKVVAERQKSITGISKAVGAAITDGKINGKDIADTIASVAKAYNVEIPAREVHIPSGFDPATANIKDCRMMMAALFHANKSAEIEAIADVAGQMLEAFKLTVKKAG